MPRHAKGPRLYLREAYDGRSAAWIIRDGTRQRGTGLGLGATEKEKAEALRAYLTEAHTDAVSVGKRDPSQILIADVLAKYARDVVAKHADPAATASRLEHLKPFWSGHTLDYVTGDTCDAYAAQRTSPSVARRELEDFRAAIVYHRKRGLHDKIVSVVLPEKSAPREQWLSRDQAAAAILAAWRYREVQNHRGTDRYTRRHVARFMLFARYMGSRASVICSTSIERVRPKDRPWVDLSTGLFHGLPEGHRATKKRRQRVHVPPGLLAHLRRWRRKGQRYVVEWNGNPVESIDRAHAAAIADATLPDDVTPHTWRHTVATWLMQAGVDPIDAAEFLAMTVETLLRVYGHHRRDNSARVHAAFRAHRRNSFVTDTSEQKPIPGHGNVVQFTVKPAKAS